jgi:hypothetical protein
MITFDRIWRNLRGIRWWQHLLGSTMICLICIKLFYDNHASRFQPHSRCQFAGRYSTLVFDGGLLIPERFADDGEIEVLKYVNCNLSRGDFLAISALPRLVVLDLSGSTFALHDFLLLEHCSSLRVLVLDRIPVSNEDLLVVTSFKGIRSISVADCEISDRDLIALSDIPSLQTLAIGTRNPAAIEEHNRSRAPRLQVTDSLGKFYTLPPTILL